LISLVKFDGRRRRRRKRRRKKRRRKKRRKKRKKKRKKTGGIQLVDKSMLTVGRIPFQSASQILPDGTRTS